MTSGGHGHGLGVFNCFCCSRNKSILIYQTPHLIQRAHPPSGTDRSAFTALDLSVQAKQNMASDNEHRPFPFLDLPAEIRNQIYDYLLPDNGTIRLDSYWSRPLYRSRTHLNRILQKCHQVHKEASPMLYSSRAIAFGSSKAFLLCLKAIGPMKHHIRHILIGRGWSYDKMRSAFHRLKSVTSLRTIDLGPGARVRSTEKIALTCKQYVMALQRTKSSEAERRAVMDVIQTIHQAYGPMRKAIAEAYGESLRTELRKSLG